MRLLNDWQGPAAKQYPAESKIAPARPPAPCDFRNSPRSSLRAVEGSLNCSLLRTLRRYDSREDAAAPGFGARSINHEQSDLDWRIVGHRSRVGQGARPGWLPRHSPSQAPCLRDATLDSGGLVDAAAARLPLPATGIASPARHSRSACRQGRTRYAWPRSWSTPVVILPVVDKIGYDRNGLAPVLILRPPRRRPRLEAVVAV